MSVLLAILIATFAVVMIIMLGVYWAFILRPESHEQASLRKRLKVERGTASGTKLGRLEKPKGPSEASVVEKAALRAGRMSGSIAQLIKQADIQLSLTNFVLLSTLCALVTYLAVWWIVRLHLLALVVAVLAAAIPYLYIRHKRNQRIWKFEEQFPEAIDLIARALRAGHAFTTAMAMVADEVDPPVGKEFRLLYDRQNYGMPLSEAMKDLAVRVPLIDARFFVTAVLMQRETGGNLAEVLDNLASVIRDRFQVKRQVRVLTAHGRITGWVLAGLPPALALALFLMVPNHLMMLIQDPLGVQMIVGAVVLQIIGTLIIRKLVNIPY